MPPLDFSFKSSTQAVRRYLLGIGLIINLIVLSVFLGFYLRTDALFHQLLIRNSRAFFDEIVITRKWLARNQGVYVRMKPGDQVNPYLKAVPGLKAEIRDENGDRYMLKNPALATREISAIAAREGSFKFHITSLNPLNPENAPDLFERKALIAFETGVRDIHDFENGPEGKSFRFMAPLVTEESCLRCHAHQGYKVGDIRGGISVTIPAQAIMREIRANKTYLTFSVLGVILVIVFFIYFIARYFIRDLQKAEVKLLEMATTDSLTGLLNRREGFRRILAEFSRAERSGQPLCAMMLDLDHFKMVNDTYGHLTGDSVLIWMAGTLKNSLRGSDIICRYGGEEFLVVLPETRLENIKILAERLRRQVEQYEFHSEDLRKMKVTISVGLAEKLPEETYDQLIARVDKALYQAKGGGRNRVCFE